MPVELKDLEERARHVGRLIGQHMPPGVGFALLVFDFGEGGHMTWLSNAERESMIEAMQEMVARLQEKTETSGN